MDHVTDADTFAATRTFVQIGPSGRPTILYCNGPGEGGGFDLKVARPLSGESFHLEDVDPADQGVTGYASLAVDSRGRPHVSYVSGWKLDQGILKYARRRAGGWSIEVADAVKAVAETALAVDSQDRPLIAFTKLGDQLRLATRGPSGWVSSEVSHAQVEALDLAVDGSDHPRIAYVAWDGSAYVLRLASFDGSTWANETVGHVSSQGIEFGVDLLIDPQGESEIVFTVLEPVRGLAFAQRSPSGWRLDPVSAGDLWQPTATLDAAGAVHVVFYDATRGALVYARQVGGGWRRQTVADDPSPHIRIGRQSSIALDAQGRAHVSYYVGDEFTGTTLRYAVSTPV